MISINIGNNTNTIYNLEKVFVYKHKIIQTHINKDVPIPKTKFSILYINKILFLNLKFIN